MANATSTPFISLCFPIPYQSRGVPTSSGWSICALQLLIPSHLRGVSNLPKMWQSHWRSHPLSSKGCVHLRQRCHVKHSCSHPLSFKGCLHRCGDASCDVVCSHPLSYEGCVHQSVRGTISNRRSHPLAFEGCTELRSRQLHGSSRSHPLSIKGCLHLKRHVGKFTYFPSPRI